MNCLAL